MDINDTLVGALIGSLGTLLPNILNKTFELFQKRQDHRHQHDNLTQKDLFDRKIKIAEAAVAQFTQMKVIFYMTHEIIDTILQAIRYKLPIDVDVLRNITKEFSVLVERAESYDTASVSLYFDIKDNIGDQDLIQEFLCVVFTIRALHKSFKMKAEKNTMTNEDKENLRNVFVKSLVVTSQFFKTLEDDISENIRKIKSDMKELKAI